MKHAQVDVGITVVQHYNKNNNNNYIVNHIIIQTYKLYHFHFSFKIYYHYYYLFIKFFNSFKHLCSEIDNEHTINEHGKFGNNTVSVIYVFLIQCFDVL